MGDNKSPASKSGRKMLSHKIAVIVYLLIYFSSFFFLMKISYIDFVYMFGIKINAVVINGVITQIQIMAMIGFITSAAMKKRFLLAHIFNASFFLSSAILVVFFHLEGAVPGFAIAVSLYIIIMLIQKYDARIMLSLQDVQKKNEQLQKMVYFDIMTGLPNRQMIVNRMNFLIQNPYEEQDSFAVVMIDLNNFKQINDLYGHSMGDKFINKTAQILKEFVDERDILGRLVGGDEFILVIQRRLKGSELYQYVDHLRDYLCSSVLDDELKLSISASFGVSTYPEDAQDPEQLLKYADIAMYSAQKAGRNAIEFFNRSLYTTLKQSVAFEQNLKTAVSNEEMFLNFQPQYFAKTKRLRGFEVLLRWTSAQYGFISPAKFIPIAEETGLIVPIGEWVFYQSCKKLAQIMQMPACRNIVMSVNLSVVQIMESGFMQMIDRVLKETKVSPANLEVEITESVFISSADYVMNILNQIKQRGIRISLDDFGTGYSSLNYLQMLPIDVVKIDKSFVDCIGGMEAQSKIVGSLIELFHRLDLSVVAEGVENEMQKDYLVENACDYIQGFLWGKPLLEKEADELLLQQG
ncbi:MAG TPA: EAL domain-containing protein [Lachnospiraceae bacterium]|nr:EAL domain-containing protein [Lachnospiraceae bacterium]